jgi:dimethylamine/trimethylamine dehydrogenase
MARDPRHDILFEPVKIGPKTLRNRFYQVPHCTGFGVEKPWSQARHRALKAEGGWAAVCTEYAAVSPESDETPYVSARIWDDHDVRMLALMCDEAHEHGALAGIELGHTGVQAENSESRLPAVGPSQIASDFAVGVIPKAMTRRDIRKLAADWATAARRSRDAGFDIVYAYGAHTYLLGQFLSPHYNRRTDEYGGSLENRARLWLEVLEAVREAVGDHCAIACRVAVDRLEALGVDLDEGLEFIRLADHLVDLWDVNVGSISEWYKDSGPSRFYAEGWQLDSTRHVRQATAKPIVGVARLTNPDLMADIVRSGAWDLIGAARPSIADPFLPAKIDDGRIDEIRECIGCNVCISKADSRRHIGCTQNATAGEEFRRGWHPERFGRAANADGDALVVGGGPAGMECAIVLAKRGFRRVRLVDRAPMMGGHLALLTRLPGLGEWGRVGAWRMVQLNRLPAVELITDTRLDAAEVRSTGAAVTVIATGSSWARDGLHGFSRAPIPGADASSAHVLVPEQVVLEGKRPPGRRVVVYDGDGYFMATAIAELLVREGFEVRLVTGHELVAPFADETLEAAPSRARMHALGVAMHRGVTPVSIEPGRFSGQDEFGEPFDVECDGVVLVTQRLSDDALYHELDGSLPAVYRLGDCVAPRLLADAVWDGHRLAREIDSADPELALAYRRERPSDELPPPPSWPELFRLPRPPAPATRRVELVNGDAAARIAQLAAEAAPDVVICAGRGAGDDLAPYRALAERLGGRFAVTRPQVEAGRAGRPELVGASSSTVQPRLYLAFGVSGALPHLAGMHRSATVVAVNTDRGARIFDHADLGVVADAGQIIRELQAAGVSR